MHFHHCKERRLYRAWLHYGVHGRMCSSIEVAWLTKHCHITFEFDDEKGWGISLAIPPVAGWLHIGLPRALSLKRHRQVQVSIHSGGIWWTFWRDWRGWSSDVPRWREGNFNVVDFLLGRRKCTTRDLEMREIVVPMPERSYPATAKLVEYTWRRPRWFAKRVNRVQIDVPEGLPHAGKGENSWDCGDDATFGITTGPCRSIPEGIGILVGSVLERRVRYGGWSDFVWSREPALGA